MSQGAFSQLRWGFEGVRGIPAASAYAILISNLQFTPQRPNTPRKDMNPRGQLLQPRNIRTGLAWSWECEPVVDAIARFRVHQQRYAVLSNPTAGVYQFAARDRLSGDSYSEYTDTFWFEADRDDTYAQINYGCRMETCDVKVTEGKMMSLKMSGLSEHFSHCGAPSLTTTGGTYTGKMAVRGVALANPEGATNLLCKCNSGGALDGTATVRFTEGVVAYAGAGIPVYSGVPIRMVGADGIDLSLDPLDPLEMVFGAGGTLSTNDEVTITRKRTKGTATYSTGQPLTMAGLVFKVASTEYLVEDFGLRFHTPMRERRGSNSKYPKGGIWPDGTRRITVTMSRELYDRILYNAWLKNASVSVDFDAYGGYIGATSYRERWRVLAAHAILGQAGADITGEKALDEKCSFDIFYDPSDSANPDAAETIVHTLSSLAA